MRHKKKNNQLGRTTAHRNAMLSNMATSLIMHKRIFTTVPKAKALRKYVEPIITRSKEDTTNSRRMVFSLLQNKYAVAELFLNVSPKVGDRPGGYTRILKTGHRLGDNASMCFIELVDFNENMLSDGKTKKTRTRRSRRKSTGDAAAVVAGTETPKAKKATEAKAKEVKETEESVKDEAVLNEATPVVETVIETVTEEVPVEAAAEEAPVAEEAPEQNTPEKEGLSASEKTATEEPKEE